MPVSLPQLEALATRKAGLVRRPFSIERISIEVTNRCPKACWFCYNHSGTQGDTLWTPAELIAFITNCASRGVKAVSLGGGEPLVFPGIFDVLAATRALLFRSMTTSGIGLTDKAIARLADAGINKVHVSIHFPDRQPEITRVISQVHALAQAGIASGINLLVARSQLDAATHAAVQVRAAGIDNSRIVYLPMRHQDTPTARELSRVAGDLNFQSMSCLTHCASSPRFCSIGWNKLVGWCSYTTSREPIEPLTFDGLNAALDTLDLNFCGGSHES